MRLSDKLKEIYTSGDTFTVLQLLDKMIKEVEKYEVENTAVYQHVINIAFESGTHRITLINTNPDVMSISDIVDYLGEYGQILTVDFDGVNPVLCYFHLGNGASLTCTAINLTTDERTNTNAVSIIEQNVKEI
jgi:hypothetical protein